MPRAAVRNSLAAAVRRQRNIHLAAQLQRQQHVLLHHVDVEPGLLRHLEHERPAILHHRRCDRAVGQNVDRRLRAIPLFSASSTPSEKASICTARLRLVAIFIDTARPLSPTCVTFGRCRAGRLHTLECRPPPPTIIESFPCCSVMMLPETGASTMSAPSWRTSASARLDGGADGAHVDDDFTWAPRPASIPSGPSVTASSAAESVTIENVMSRCAADRAGRVAPTHAAVDQPVAPWHAVRL